MIIADEDDAQKIKDPPAAFPAVRYPERAASRRSLPDYETSQALAFGSLNDSQSTLHKPPPRRRLLDSRVWRAIVTSLVVYIFLTIVIGVPIIVHKELEDPPRDPYSAFSYLGWSGKPSPYLSGPNITSPAQLGIYPTCNNWTSVEFFESSSSTLVFAVTERYVSPVGQFSITSNASSSHDLQIIQGAFHVGINPNETVQDAVLSIMMQSPSPSVFNRTLVCFALANNFTDLSLSTPNNLTATDNILYNVTLLFPQTASPLHVDSFSTFLPLFDQQFSSFGDNVTFGKFAIGGGVSKVTVDSVEAKRVIVDTSLEPVMGTFHADTSLLISTVMAPIVANISLYNDPDHQFATTLDVHTGNDNVTANVTMLVPDKQSLSSPSRPNFIANLRTFSGALSTSFLHDPSSSPAALRLHVANDLGPVDVTLDGLFQGPFEVSTKQATAYVSQGSARIPDPWNSSLERTMQMDSSFVSRSMGWIGWGDVPSMWNNPQIGQVTVDTSLADASLLFLG